MNYTLELSQLTKTYAGDVKALRSIDLNVEVRDFYALLGPNRARKSTTIGIISSLVNKTTGTVRVFGYDIDKDIVNAKRQLGIVPQGFNFNLFETVTQIVVPTKLATMASRGMKRWRARRNTSLNLICGVNAMSVRSCFPEV